ncbi:hypothetical protein AB0392_09465 [Nonomuraea angiospora]
MEPDFPARLLEAAATTLEAIRAMAPTALDAASGCASALSLGREASNW